MWRAVTSIQEKGRGFLFYVDVLTRQEESRIFADHPEKRSAVAYGNRDTVSEVLSLSYQVEQCRPFLGEQLYAMFFAYRAFYYRVPLALHEAATSLNGNSWRADPGINQILQTMLTPDELQELNELPTGAFTQATRMIERNILRQTEMLVSGESSADTSMRILKKIDASGKTIPVNQ